MPSDPADDPVEIVPWPTGQQRRVALAAEGRPRLLLVPPDVLPPDVWESIEDWVRTTAEPGELDLRRAHLAKVAAAQGARARVASR